MENLGKLFGGIAKVKLMRLFLFNPDASYDLLDIITRTKTKPRETKEEVINLQKLGLLKKKGFYKDFMKKKGKKETVVKKKTSGWSLDGSFPYMVALKNLLINVTLPAHEDIARRIGHTGRIKLVLFSGVFIQDWDSRVDLLVVGDGIKHGKLENVIHTLEAEIGRELRYTVFDTPDFHYRLSIYDKLVRDILDYPHIKVVDKLGVTD
ncbi:MAG TPA: hypothetical protein VJH55_03815 [Candidatus Paceibacterota bacterium]